MARVMIKWKYPFQPSVETVLGRQGRQDRAMESTEREEKRREEAEVSQRPIAKPRVKVTLFILSVHVFYVQMLKTRVYKLFKKKCTIMS